MFGSIALEEARVSKGVWRICFKAHSHGSWQEVSVSYYMGLSIILLRLPRSGDEREGGRERKRENTQDGSYSPIISNLRNNIASLLPGAIGHIIMEGTRQGCE